MTPARGFATAAAVLAAASAGGIWLPGWTYLPINLALLGVLVGIARRSGATPADLGTERSRLSRGFRLGAAVGIAAAAAIVTAAAVPAAGEWFKDERAGGIGPSGLIYQVVLRIPIGTALFEEAAFRGVLLGLGRMAWGRRPGAWAASLAFGLWHIVPARVAADANAAAAQVPAALILVLAVIGTALAGMVFTVVRDRAASLAAPVLVHAATNVTAFFAAWLLL
jgi:membrane protease YdiL (CAAX protease family)